MTVELLHHTPLSVCSTAIRRCWSSHDRSDNGGEADKKLIDRIGNKAKHESVKNHINYTFDIQGITTKTLLALTRHDVGVEFSVQSSRYTTKKCVQNGTAGYTKTASPEVNDKLAYLSERITECVDSGLANDDIAMLLPQAWHYNLICTMSMSAVQHFLTLRLKKDAHSDIRELAQLLHTSLPEEHKYLFEDCFVEKTTITKTEYNELLELKSMYEGLCK
jgi:thymidylate synthase (FAD)